MTQIIPSCELIETLLDHRQIERYKRHPPPLFQAIEEPLEIGVVLPCSVQTLNMHGTSAANLRVKGALKL